MVEVVMRPHDVIYVRTHSGDRQQMSNCMIERLDADEFVEGCIPDNVPEYGDTVMGAPPCHEDWRGGCPGNDPS